MVHSRLVDLDLLESLHCHIKSLFEFHGWTNIFSNTPKISYELLIRLFYANLRSMCFDELEILVMGKHIYLKYTMFDDLFDINCFGFSNSSKNSWLSDFDISFELVMKSIVLDNSNLLSSALSPKFLAFQIRVIDHIVATTLLPRVDFLSTLSQ
ncbi:hypothetical protein FXO37_15917 [Capsicum annuum]|nr:hypothetical protein FXO37_15917 [Capsicum annuum]